MQPQNLTIAYYITPHGFGHAVRSLEVIRRLFETEASLRLILVSDLPDFLVETTLGRSLPVRRRRLDVGLIQKDSLRFDLDATRAVLEDLYRRREDLVREEVRFLRSERVDGIVSDIPFLPFQAAASCGVPSIGMSNFTWDWIYDAYARRDARWSPLVSWIRECYGRCDLFLQLPMHGDASSCPRIEDAPLVARKAGCKREETRQALGLPPGRKACLISFAALELDDEAQKRIEEIEDAIFYYSKPLAFHLTNGRSLADLGLPYVDTVAAMDAVITKPGYGIVSDCLTHGIPMAYTDRGLFPEYEILVEEIKRRLPAVYLPSEELYSGRWDDALKRLGSLPRLPVTVRDDGAAFCAGRIIDLVASRRGAVWRGSE